MHLQQAKNITDNGCHLQQCLQSNSSSDDPNSNYFTSLCTVFVATIQETKDRISQLEFIFCSQLFPTIQSELTKSRNTYKRVEKIKQDAEEEWNQNKKTLLLELDKLQTERKNLEEQIQHMKMSFEQEKKELSSVFELQKEGLNRKHSLEKEELFSRLETVHKSDETLKLREELRQRLEEISEGKLLQESLLQQISRMDDELKMVRQRQNLHDSELERERKSKQDFIEQYKYLKRMYKGLKTQYDVIIGLNGISTDKCSSAKKKAQNDNYTSPDNLKQMSLSDCHAQAAYRGETRMIPAEKEGNINSNGNPMEADHQDGASIENKNKNGKPRAGSYSSKIDQDDNQVSLNLDKKLENARDEGSPPKTSVDGSKCVPFEDEETQEQAHEVSKQTENHGFRAVKERMESLAPFPQQKQLQKRPLEPRSGPPNLAKRKNSSWRETRLRKEHGKCVDPHDDFLDTPMEIALQSGKRNLEVCADVPEHMASIVEDNCACPGEAQNCQMNQNNVILDDDEDDDEKQAIDPDCAQQTSHARSANLVCNSGGIKLENLDNKSPSYLGKSKEQNLRHAHKGGISYKYIEPVRKKAERENLKGVECNQCKKFYDAVQVGDGDVTGDIRCEHHNEVSRHRYRYIPPATPEGFWNIGFDSDL